MSVAIERFRKGRPLPRRRPFDDREFLRMTEVGILRAGERLDVREAAIEVHRQPEGERYASIRIVRRGEVITPVALPDVAVPVDEVLG